MTTLNEPPEATSENPDARLIASLRAGDEDAFMRLVEQYHGQLIRVALMYVATRDVAEDVVQETRLGVLKGLDRFEGRSSLRTWIFRIVTNIAKTGGGFARLAACPSPPWPMCNVLELSETNQRVLLHRARAKVRRALEVYLDG